MFAWEEVTQIINKTAGEYESTKLLAHKDSAMEIYEKIFHSEYLPTVQTKTENDKAVEESLVKHQ